MSRAGRYALLALLAAGAVGTPASISGQESAVAPTAPAETTASAKLPLGARLPSPFAAYAPEHPLPVVAPQDRGSVGPNVALMAVGGAALIIGLVIGGDSGMIIASTGGVLGLVGLYRYLR